MYFISFRKVFYRIPELHNVLIYRILFDRIQSPPLNWSIFGIFSKFASITVTRAILSYQYQPWQL
jgi:hypothetical protein